MAGGARGLGGGAAGGLGGAERGAGRAAGGGGGAGGAVACASGGPVERGGRVGAAVDGGAAARAETGPDVERLRESLRLFIRLRGQGQTPARSSARRRAAGWRTGPRGDRGRDRLTSRRNRPPPAGTRSGRPPGKNLRQRLVGIAHRGRHPALILRQPRLHRRVTPPAAAPAPSVAAVPCSVAIVIILSLGSSEPAMHRALSRPRPQNAPRELPYPHSSC